MNKFIGYLAFGIISIGAISAFSINPETKLVDDSLEIPEEVSAVLNSYCFGCHNTESKKEKAKNKLIIDQLGDLPTGKLAAKLNKLAKEVDEGDMPPAKFLAKYPDKEPSKKERKIIVKWAKKAAEEL